MLSDTAADSIGLTVRSSLVALLQLNLRRLLAHFFSFYVAHFFFYETYFRAEGIDLTVRTKFLEFVRHKCKLHSTVNANICEHANPELRILKSENENVHSTTENRNRNLGIISKRILGRRNKTQHNLISHPSSPIEKVTVSDSNIKYTDTHNYQSPSCDIGNRRS